jgi:hypothetical protein
MSMTENPLTWEDIRSSWLDPSDAEEVPAVVEAFERVRTTLGPEWLQARWPRDETSQRGAFPMFQIALLGEELRAIEGAVDSASLIARVRRGNRDARAELLAARIARGPLNEGEVEFGPTVQIGNRNRRPDFRIRSDSADDWVYVEVTAPDDSDEGTRLRTILEHLVSRLADQTGGYVLEVVLRRTPTSDEMTSLERMLPELALKTESRRVDLEDGLGFVLANHGEPGTVVLADHGEEPTSRIGMTSARVVNGLATSTLTVRIAYTDERAGDMIDHEARQLSPGCPGLIMIDMAGVIAGRGIWDGLVRRRLQPSVNTRVSAVALTMAAVIPGEAGLGLVLACRTAMNPHARVELPDWLRANLEAWPQQLVDES